jgi:TolA-binding protein
MSWDLTIVVILVVGSTAVALLALGNRSLLVHVANEARRKCHELTDELAKVRKQSDDRQAQDAELISRLQNRITQQGQMLRSLQEDLDKFIAQHRSTLEVTQRSGGASPQETEAVEQRERAIRERLRNMLQEFRTVTDGLKDAEPPAKAA